VKRGWTSAASPDADPATSRAGRGPRRCPARTLRVLEGEARRWRAGGVDSGPTKCHRSQGHAGHAAITEGRLKVKGRAPDGLTWEGPFGVIEKPLPLPSLKKRSGGMPSGSRTPPRAGAGTISREGRVPYGVPARPNFGSRDPAPGEGWYVRRVPVWTSLDPKRPLGSVASERVAESHGGP